MTPELAYFLKINAGIALFYAFYRLFFYKDTFFQWRRIALFGFFILSLVYPLMNLQEWIRENEPMVAMADLYATMVLPEFTVEAQPQAIDWKHIILTYSDYLYVGGVILLLIRFLLQLSSILRLRFNCPARQIQGTHIYELRQKAGPFSFFHWIFIHPASHTDEELSEILAHEQAHARQYHSVDVIFSELICIACWFNPFVWLMKREIRSNLEYMADSRVIQTGHDHKAYQFHLLGLAHQKAAANLSNSFNVLPLKNRITMMNKKRTRDIGRTKYLIFLPLATLLMIISNIEAVARTTKSFAKEVMQTVEQHLELAPSQPPMTEQAPPQDKKKVNQNNEKEKTNKEEEKGVIFEVVEQSPEFPGGRSALLDYLGKNVRYPQSAHAQGIQGRVIVQFVVEKDGKPSNPTVVKNISPDLDAEAIRVISTMPDWIPGKQRGENVRVKFTVPISFRLAGDAVAEEIKDNNLPEMTVVGYGPDDNGIDIPAEIFDKVDQMPRFPGGLKALMSYLSRNVKYPTAAQQSKIEGRVIVEMVVNKDGYITSPKVVQSVSPTIDAEAIRVVSNMPKWEPGMKNGKAVAVKYALPVLFRLDSPKYTPTVVKE